jgi:hypothetical protein
VQRTKRESAPTSHVRARGSAESIRQQMVMAIAAEWEKEAEFLYPMQKAFDAVDKPADPSVFGCSIYLE